MAVVEASTMTEATTELTDADLHGCRWIEGEATPIRSGMWCCAPPAPGSAWCPRHRQIVWSYKKPRLDRPVRPVQGRYAGTKGAPLSCP
jgi:hypothetical protein